ncbi:MAG: hypothetical protein K2L53_02515, partial [Clostridia bacterium]|nr:hypothetical protein [Clostridia bacterium]
MKLGIKQKNTLIVLLIIVVAIVFGSSIGLGVYFGVNNDRFSGYVYDSDGNTPLAGVAVTNGRDVVKTDADGKFTLDGWLKGRFITVTIPNGYWTEDYYIEMGKAKDGYDFYLDKKDVDETD